MFVINSLAGGGAEKVLMTLLHHSGHRADHLAISLTLLDNDPDEAISAPRWLEVHRLDCNYGIIKSFNRLRSHVACTGPQVIVSFLTRSNVATWFAMRGRSQAWIVSERTNTLQHLGSGVRGLVARSLVRLAYPKASRIIAVSKGVAKTLVRNFAVPAEKIDVISNPVAIDLTARNGDDGLSGPIAGPYIVAVGRLVPIKNHSILIEAFARSDFQGKLVIVGEGPERSRIVRLAKKLGVGERMILTGYLSNPHRVMSGALLYVSASRNEGFPNALVEALNLKVPVVTTNCRDGPAEILLDKTADEIEGTTIAATGILTPVDDLEALTKAISMATSPAVRARFLGGIERRADDLTPQGAADRYWAVIDDLLAATRAESDCLTF